MDNVYYIVTERTFFNNKPVALFSTRDAAYDYVQDLHDETGKSYIVQRVELVA